MSAPSRAEVFGEVIELRERLDAIQRAWDDDDVDAIGNVLSGGDLEDEADDDEFEDEDDDEDEFDDEELDD